MEKFQIGQKIWRMVCPPPNGNWARADYSGRIAWPDIHAQQNDISPNSIGEIQWIAGATAIADFTWPHGFVGARHIVAKAEVAEELTSKFAGAILFDIQYSPPERKAKRRKFVPYPYNGPPQKMMWFTHVVEMAEKWTTISRKTDAYGLEQTLFQGIEVLDYDYDTSVDQNLQIVHKLRESGKGIFVERSSLAANEFFRFRRWPQAYMCTDKVKQYIQDSGYTNICLLEMGNVIEIIR